MAQRVSSTTTEHEKIRSWVEERGGWPAEVEATGRDGETGILRIDFPGYGGEGKLRRISWDEWFEKFEDAGLALVYEETTAGGERSNFNKLVARETAEARARGERTSRRGRRTRATGGARRGAGSRRSAPAKTPARPGGMREASRAEAARTTRRRGAKAGARGKRGAGGSRAGTSRRGGTARGGTARGGRRGGGRGGKARSR